MVESPRKKPECLAPITIQFGDVVIRRRAPDKRYVVVDVGSGDSCCASLVQTRDNGVEILVFGGTTFRRDIERVAPEERWSLERILAAHAAYLTGGLTARVENELRTNSKKEPRVLSSC